MSSYTEGQVHQLVDRMEAEGFTTEHITKLGQMSNLRDIRFVLDGQAKIVSIATTVAKPKIITINRNRFNPAEFIGAGWSIITDETDTRSTALTELDLTKVQQVTMLKSGENVINGEEKLKRLKKSGNIRLDADIFLTLWQNQLLIPESWKEKINGNTRYIFFDGTVLRHSYGDRYVLCLCWGDGKWHWYAYWLASTGSLTASLRFSQVSAWDLVTWLFGTFDLCPWALHFGAGSFFVC